MLGLRSAKQRSGPVCARPGLAPRKSARRHIGCYNGSSSHGRFFTHLYAAQHHGTSGDPTAATDRDRGIIVFKGGRVAVVAAGDEERCLRQAHVIPKSYGLQIQEPYVLPDPAVITDYELPGPKHTDSVSDKDPVADLRTKEAK